MARPKPPKKPRPETILVELGGARPLPAPNQALLDVLAQIDQGASPSRDLNTLEYLREARAGAMYDRGPDE
jgi:hypothetical protein